MTRRITIKYTGFRECPNCEGGATTAPPGGLIGVAAAGVTESS
jgi:hypothetical protein